MRKASRQKHTDLSFAKRWLGLIGNKRLIFAAAADALQVSRPVTVDEGYKLLAQFRHAFTHSPRPSTSKRLRVQVDRPDTSWVNGDRFLESYEWRRLRMVVLKKRGARCECCGATRNDGVRMHVDHIKPRRKHPELALIEANLQVLCEVCNHGKGAWDETDWRTDSHLSGESSADSPVPRSGDGDEQKAANATGAHSISKGCAPGPRLLRKLADSA